MATARSARLRAHLLVLPLTAGVAAALAVVPSAPSAAAPAAHDQHLSLRQVKAQITVLDRRAERITEAFDAARGQLSRLRQEQSVSARTLAQAQQTLSRSTARVAAAASAAYRSGATGSAMSLIATSSAGTIADRTATLDQVAAFDDDQVAAATAAARQVAQARAVSQAQVAQAQATVAAITSERTQVQRLLSTQHHLLTRLTAADRRRYAHAQAATRAHELGLRSSPHAVGSGQGAAAVAFAYAQLGKPYVYGAAGPGSYDCSGLAMAAWSAAGVGLPHNAAAQQASVAEVPLSAMRPGDLVFFGHPAYHVGIYIGGGRMIQAPHTGDVVRISPVDEMSPSSAGRP